MNQVNCALTNDRLGGGVFQSYFGSGRKSQLGDRVDRVKQSADIGAFKRWVISDPKRQSARIKSTDERKTISRPSMGRFSAHVRRAQPAPTAADTSGVHRSTYYAWKRQVDRHGLGMTQFRAFR
jgi:hypothetical protein